MEEQMAEAERKEEERMVREAMESMKAEQQAEKEAKTAINNFSQEPIVKSEPINEIFKASKEQQPHILKN